MEARRGQDLQGRKWSEDRQSSDVVLIRSLYMPVAIGTIVLGAIFAGLGVLLVYLGASGQTHMKLFGASLETASVGVACMFLAVVMVILVLRSLFKSVKAMDIKHERFEPTPRGRTRPLPFDKE